MTTNIVQVPGFAIEVGDGRDMLGIAEVFVLGAYPTGLLRQGDLVLDVGAGVGDYSLLASKAVGESGLVVAIEANPSDFDLLVRNLDRNRISNVVPIQAAAGLGDSQVELEFKGRRFVAPTVDLTTTMDRIRSDHAGLGPLRVIKMDVEGAEVTALGSLAGCLNTVRAIAIELHRTGPAVLRLLSPLGFRFTPLTRGACIRNTVFFGLRHPLTLIRIWARLRRHGLVPSFLKMLDGLGISSGRELLVGTFTR